MSMLFRAVVEDVSEKVVRVSLRVTSAEVTRLWTSKSFALSLLLEPIVLGVAEPSPELALVLPRERIVGVDLPAWKKAASKVVTSCALEQVHPALPAFRQELAACEPSDLPALLDSDRTPVATYRIGVKPRMATHLVPGLAWDSAACDMP